MQLKLAHVYRQRVVGGKNKFMDKKVTIIIFVKQILKCLFYVMTRSGDNDEGSDLGLELIELCLIKSKDGFIVKEVPD